MRSWDRACDLRVQPVRAGSGTPRVPPASLSMPPPSEVVQHVVHRITPPEKSPRRPDTPPGQLVWAFRAYAHGCLLRRLEPHLHTGGSFFASRLSAPRFRRPAPPSGEFGCQGVPACLVDCTTPAGQGGLAANSNWGPRQNAEVGFQRRPGRQSVVLPNKQSSDKRVRISPLVNVLVRVRAPSPDLTQRPPRPLDFPRLATPLGVGLCRYHQPSDEFS